MTRDPVCGMEVDEQRAVAKADYQGKTYFFCSDACKARFEKAPQRYAAGGKGERKGGG